MPEFHVGDRVVYIRTNETGTIQVVHPAIDGRQQYTVSFPSGEARCLERYLERSVTIANPFDKCKRGMFGSCEDFTRINTTFKLENTSNNTLSTLMASKTVFKAYQYKPLLKFLNSENRRILVADEVGLGKTIEAGHIMMELKARKEMRSALVICPHSLLDKWHDELEEKFGFDFKIYDDVQELIYDLKHRPEIVRGIINYEKVRLSRKDEEKLEDIASGKLDANKWMVAKETLHHLLYYSSIRFDFVLCDEAHRMRNSNTQLHKGMRMLIEHSKSVVFLTATPIMISQENLFNLLNLLDENRFDNFPQFNNALIENRPFIEALGKLAKSNNNLSDIMEDLNSAQIITHYQSGSEETQLNYDAVTTIGERYADVPLYQEIMAKSKLPDTPQLRVQLQTDLSSMSMINNIFTRTRKKEVALDLSQATRDPQTHYVNLYPEERQIFDEIIEEYKEDNSYIDEYGDSKMSMGATLGLIQKKRRVASSVYGYQNETYMLDAGIDMYADKPDAKFDKLTEIIHAVVDNNRPHGNKIIIFALFKDTLKYLAIRLEKLGYKTAMIHGDIVENRIQEIERFRDNDDVKILLSSEVGSEGLDMQFCDSIVNYDLPWNPMVVEQRIGRVDRFGQKSPIVHIYNLIVADSIQEDIYKRLLDRIDIFKGCIGDLEAILDKDLEVSGLQGKSLQQIFVSLEKELYCTKITKEQEQAKIDAVAQAIIREKKNLEDITEELTNTLTNDAYFTNEINSIQRNHRYITDKELESYIRNVIRYKLTTCTLETLPDGTYIFHVPQDTPRVLTAFLAQYEYVGAEYEKDANRFRTKIRDLSEIRLAFNRDIAQQHPGCIYIDPYHPFILAAMQFFKQRNQEDEDTFQYVVPKETFKDMPAMHTGEYFLALYQLVFKRTMYGKAQNLEILLPILYDKEHGKMCNDADVAEHLLGEAQLYARPMSHPVLADEQLLDLLANQFTDEICEQEDQKLTYYRTRLESTKQVELKRQEEYHNNKIEQEKQTIARFEKRIEEIKQSVQYYRGNYKEELEQEQKNLERVLPSRRGILRGLEKDKNEALERVRDCNIEQLQVYKLISLSHVIVE